ncbi:MAG: ATP-dependent RNA helicase DbpA [Rudaea sp.]|uniref:ATP-dependent RNA helicase DbpA n=1 Tax=unclassified Rudaea TaxID=2627037 RepID=UPI0010F876B1|nr:MULTISPECIES: ATP-dependent RNA helicase DbpA [unclassified Rudaea]MBN8887500.1 ATP-dependent RNA helicase DbpA [Rudaea sp.]MBR0343710.1 ATP-dependent RNA helicase DbpA [Rudaea sp.]
MSEFSSLPLAAPLLKALATLNFTEMTAVQAQSLPAMLAGRDLIAQAPTGSGKTIAFGLGLLQRLDPAQVKPQALVLCPTRELADQVAKEIRRLAFDIPNLKVLTLTGGVALGPQLASLRKDSHVVVGTPGRVQEMLRKHALSLAKLRTLVLDEADRMLDMGFAEAIGEIVGKTPSSRQSLLFSATFPDAIREMARATLRDPLEVTVAAETERPEIDEQFFEIDLARKPAALAALLLHHRPESSVVFCNTRRDVDDVVEALGDQGIAALALHGDIEQRDRDEVLVRFANRSCRVLVASDVAARGLDIKDLAAVVNYELPPDLDIYRHRIGRTARAGKTGLALNLVTPREVHRAHDLEKAELEKNPDASLRWLKLPASNAKSHDGLPATMATLRIDGGKTDKLRAGDILGALTGDAGLQGDAIGKIDIFPTRSYVAIARGLADKALNRLRASGIKGRKFRIARF